MVVIDFDPPRSVSLSALDENNVTLKDTSENGEQELNKMIPRATLICRPNSHPFQERDLTLESAIKVGRSVARVKPALNNAIFDCKVLSRNHALFWYKDGKFYLQDTKSSNGTFVNNQRLSKGSEESVPREVCSGDIVQFGVDVMENSRKVTHGCIVATVKLYLPDGKEAKASPSTGIQEEEDTTDLGKQDLYKLNQWIQEAVIREQVLETKLGSLQRIVSATSEAAELGWTALMEEDRLLTRIESLENQLIVTSKNFNEDKLREEIRKLYDEKNIYQDISKESLRKVLTEKMETLKKLQDTERTLSNAVDERDTMKELNEKLNTQILELASKFQSETEELHVCKKKLQEADNLQQRLEQEIEARQEIIREAKEKEKRLLAQVESWQAEVDFTKEQLVNLKQRHESINAVKEDANNKNEEDESKREKTEEKENHVEKTLLTQSERELEPESQMKSSHIKAISCESIEESVGANIQNGPCMKELYTQELEKNRLLEQEVERCQLEAQDGWAAAAQLQQYLRNLHNLLIDSKILASVDDDASGAEPSEVAESIRISIVSLKDECHQLQTNNSKNQDAISQLLERLEECQQQSETNTSNDKTIETDDTFDILSMKENLTNLSEQLKSAEMSKADIMEECHKWKLAYQTLVTHSENEDVLTASEKERCYDDTKDPGERDLHSSTEESHDVASQFLDTKNELETLKQKYENVQSEKKELEEEFSELKENYSLLSSQSKTVGRWMCMVPLAVLVLAVLIAFRPSD